MRAVIATAVAVCALALAGSAAAALVPGVYDPGNTGCPVATYANGVLHLEKNCATPTNAAAGADITGLNGQTFQSASFTLASTSQCQGGSPRFNVVTTDGTFFLGCNNVQPSGTTYIFTPQTIAAAGNQVPVPTGTIQSVSILIDVQGAADISKITVNGTNEVPLVGPPTSKGQCMNNGWKTFDNPPFKNQGQCIAYVEHHTEHGHHGHHGHHKHELNHHERGGR